MRTRITILVFSSILIFSCTKNNENKEAPLVNSNPVDSTLEIKKKELEIREREIALEEKKYADIKKQEQQIDETKYKTYNNSRFDYTVQYPSNLTKKKDSYNGDGCTFKIYNEFEMKVWGSNLPGISGRDISSIYDEELNSGGTVTFNTTKDNWFVVSGLRNNNVFYTKQFVVNGESKVLYITYPISQKDKYDKYTEKISKSFKSL